MCVLVGISLFAPVLAYASPAAEDENRKKIEQQFDHYAVQAKDLAQRAQKQVQQLQNEASVVMDRWASEVVNRPLYPDPVVSTDYACAQPRDPDPGMLPISQPLTIVPPAQPIYYPAAKLDAWKKVELGFYAQALKQVDANLKYFLTSLDYWRSQLDQIDKEAAQRSRDAAWKAARYQDVARRAAPDASFTQFYKLVITSYVETLRLYQVEVFGPLGRAKGERQPPPGLTCVIQAQESNQDFADWVNILQSSKTAMDEKGESWHEYWTGNPEARQALATCAQNEQKRRDDAVSRFRVALNPYFSARPHMRDRMLAWRKELIAGSFYNGTGDAAVSAVYGTEANLSSDNVNGFHVVDDLGTRIWFLRVPRAHPQSPIDYEFQTIDAGWGSGPFGGSTTGLAHPIIGLDSVCVANTLPAGQQLTAKYPEVEITRPFALSAPTNAPETRGGIASGADKTERP
jgi:hypothetical protein